MPRLTPASLRSRLLLAVVLLIGFLVVALNYSTFQILKTDKQSYLFQLQSAETRLWGEQIDGRVRSAMEILKALLVAADTAGAPGDALQKVMDNQTQLVSGAVLTVKDGGMSVTWGHPATSPPTPSGNLAWISASLEDLKKTGFIMKAPLEKGPVPGAWLAIAEKRGEQSTIVAGFLTLESLARELEGKSMVLTDSRGQVLLGAAGSASWTDHPLYRAAESSPLAQGTLDYKQEDLRYLGSYYKAASSGRIFTESRWEVALRAIFHLLEKIILVGLAVAGLGILLADRFSRSLTRPLQTLVSATHQVGEGNFDLRLGKVGRDEIGALASAFQLMSEKIRELIAHTIEKTRLESELAVAATIQRTLIPQPKLLGPRTCIASHYESATHCGGDWWGFFETGDRAAILIGDATGHGVPSALVTASARSCFSVLEKAMEEKQAQVSSPGEMLLYANRAVFEASLGEIMMTFFIGVIDFSSKTLTYVNAAHTTPWVVRKQADGTLRRDSLKGHGDRIGETRDITRPEETTVPFGPGDYLFLYTDGLVEATDPHHKQFGKVKTRDALEAGVVKGPEGTIEEIRARLTEHRAGAELLDDVTFLMLQVLPGNGA